MFRTIICSSNVPKGDYVWTQHEQRSKQKLQRIRKSVRQFVEDIDQIAKDDLQYTKDLFKEPKTGNEPFDE